MNQEEILANYIEKILNVHDDKLDEAYLKDVAFELGLDEAAYQELQLVYVSHMERGEAFLKQGFWDEAIAEFRQGLALNPLKPAGLFSQARAYEEKWNDTGRKAFAKEALFYARRTLVYDPKHTQAIAAIGRLQESKGFLPRNAMLWILSILAILFVGLFFTFKAFKEKTESYGPTTLQQASEDSKETQDKVLEFPNLEVPIRFDREGAEELTFIPKLSELKGRKIDHTYHLQGWLTVLQGEISKVVLEVNFVLKDNSTHLAKELTVFNRGNLPARTSDKIPFGNIVFQKIASPENLKEVYIRVIEIAKIKASDNYAESKSLEVSWAKPAEAGLALETKLRTYEMKTAGSFPHAIISLEGRNTGTVPISVLEYQVEWIDKAGKSIHKDHQFLVSSYSPALQPGETYISSRTYGLNKIAWQKIDSYRVSILRAWK